MMLPVVGPAGATSLPRRFRSKPPIHPMPRLLLFEADPDARATAAQHLVRSGFTVTACATGGEVLAALGEERPGHTEALDAIVLDAHPPDMDGIRLLRAVRMHPAQARTPILLLTRRSEDISRVLDHELRAEDYLLRPYGKRELSARLRAVLRRATAVECPGPEEVLAFGPLQVDLAPRLATCAGENLDMTRREFELLVHFLRNPRKVLSRDHLLHEVWGLEYLGESRTIDAHVRRLRVKLGSQAGLIETVVGVGYRLGGPDA